LSELLENLSILHYFAGESNNMTSVDNQQPSLLTEEGSTTKVVGSDINNERSTDVNFPFWEYDPMI